MNYENHEFAPWPKMARLSRECIITEKLDGTNACVYIVPTLELSCFGGSALATVIGDRAVPGSITIFAGSRTRWIQPGKNTDNYGFAAWVRDNHEELAKLGPGRHFGEYWGQGIQRNYGLTEKRFSLFNAQRWIKDPSSSGVLELNPNEEKMEFRTSRAGPSCCSVVPTLYRGEFCTVGVQNILYALEANGSAAAPGFMQPEGVIVYHIAGKRAFKKTLGDDGAKSISN